MMRRCFVFLVFAIAGVGCDDDGGTATQVVVTLDAEPGVRSDADDLRIRVEGSSGREAADWTERFDETHGVGPGSALDWPVQIALAPLDGDASRVYRIEATVLDEAGDSVGVVRAVSGYVPEQVRALRLVLEDCCRGVSCAPEQTCRSCECSDAFVPSDTLEPYDPEDPDLDAGPQDGGQADADGGIEDAGADAATCPGLDEAPVGLCGSNPVPEGTTCNRAEALMRDSSAAGLAREGADTLTTVDDHGVSACVCVQFEDAANDAIVVGARGVMDACGDSCGVGCGVANILSLFVGGEPVPGALRHVRSIEIQQDVFGDYVIPVGSSYTHALVCRTAFGHGANNIEVDYIARTRCPRATPPLQASCRELIGGCGLATMPGGTFSLGEPDAVNATPVQSDITVSGFVMDRSEVTVKRFREFWAAGARTPTGPIEYPGGNLEWDASVTEPTTTAADSDCNWSTEAGDRETHPINCVDLWTAQAFCVWDGGRLPTEAEREWAARARAIEGLSSPRSYPWGEEAPVTTCDRAHWNECPGDDGAKTRRVFSFGGNGGIADLAGNVAEWTADRYQDYGGSCWDGSPQVDPICTDGDTQAIRGGSWATTVSDSLRGASRSGRHGPAAMVPGLGFRCVR